MVDQIQQPTFEWAGWGQLRVRRIVEKDATDPTSKKATAARHLVGEVSNMLLSSEYHQLLRRANKNVDQDYTSC